MSRSSPTPILERLRAVRWALLVLWLLVPQSIFQAAQRWQNFLHVVTPVTLSHHEEHHEAEHFDEVDHSHALDADTEHHREHHAEHHDHSHDQALLSGFKWRSATQQSLFVPQIAVLASVSVPPAPRELSPFGRDGPEAESPPTEHLSRSLPGRSPPIV